MNINSFQSLAQNLQRQESWRQNSSQNTSNIRIPLSRNTTQNGNIDIENGMSDESSNETPSTDINLINHVNNINLNVEEEEIATNSSLSNSSAGAIALTKKRLSLINEQNLNRGNPQEGELRDTVDNNGYIMQDDALLNDVEGDRGEEEEEEEEDDEYIDGEWISKKPDGQGVFQDTQGNRYEGEYLDMKVEVYDSTECEIETFFHGKGKMIWADGDIYEGDWVHDSRTGNGMLKSTRAGKSYTGGFLEDEFHGWGKLTFLKSKEHPKKFFKFTEGDTYEGYFYKGEPHTYDNESKMDQINSNLRSIYTFNNIGKKGMTFEGQWAHGCPIGEGLYRFEGQQIRHKWSNFGDDVVFPNPKLPVPKENFEISSSNTERRSSGLREYFHKDLKFTITDANRYSNAVKKLGMDNAEDLFEYIRKGYVSKDEFEELKSEDNLEKLFKKPHIMKIFSEVQNSEGGNNMSVVSKQSSNSRVVDNGTISDLSDAQLSYGGNLTIDEHSIEPRNTLLDYEEENENYLIDRGGSYSAEMIDETVGSYMPIKIFESSHSGVFSLIERHFNQKLDAFKLQDKRKDHVIVEKTGMTYHYSPDVLLGTGSFGSVYLGFQKKLGDNKSINSISLTNNIAIKVISEKDTTPEAISNEISNLQILQSPATKGTTVNFVDSKVEYHGPYKLWFIIQEVGLCSLSELHEHIFSDMHTSNRWLDFAFNLKCIKALCQAISCLHENNFIHRDIHPSNIIIMREGFIKLTDVALGRHERDKNALFMSQSGTKSKSDRWQPFEVLSRMNAMFDQPEMGMSNQVEYQDGAFQQGLQNKTYNDLRSSDAVANPDVYVDIDKAIDIFQLGWTIFYIMSGPDKTCIPFPTKNKADPNAVYAILEKEAPVFPESIGSNFPLMHLIKCMLSHDSNDRPTINTVMEHPIFLSHHDKHKDLENHYKTLSTETSGAGGDSHAILMKRCLEDLILGLRDLGPDITNFLIVEPIRPLILPNNYHDEMFLNGNIQSFLEDEVQRENSKKGDNSSIFKPNVVYEVDIQENSCNQEVTMVPFTDDTNNDINLRMGVTKNFASSRTSTKPRFTIGKDINNLQIESLTDHQIDSILEQQTEPAVDPDNKMSTNPIMSGIKKKDDYKLTLRWRNILTEDIPLIFYEIADKKKKKHFRHNEAVKLQHTMTLKQAFKENLYNLPNINTSEQAFIHRISVLIILMNNCCKHLKEKDERVQQAFHAAVRGRQPTLNRIEEFVFLHPAMNWLLPAFWEVKYKKKKQMQLQSMLMNHV